MATYKVLATRLDSGKQSFAEGQIIDGSRLIVDHIPELIANKTIEEVKDTPKQAATPAAPVTPDSDKK